MELTKSPKPRYLINLVFISFLVLMSSLVFWFFVIHSKDNIIINMGIKTFARLTILAKVVAGLSGVSLLFSGARVLITHLNDKKVIEHNEEQKRIDPYYEEGEIIHKLESVTHKVKPAYRTYADRMIEQITTAKDLQGQYY